MKRTASEPGLSPSNKMQFTDRKKFITDRILLLRSVRPFTGLYAIFKSLRSVRIVTWIIRTVTVRVYWTTLNLCRASLETRRKREIGER